MNSSTRALIAMQLRQSFGLRFSSKAGRKQLGVYALLALVLIPQGIAMYMQMMLLLQNGMASAALEQSLLMSCLICSLLLIFTFPAELYFSKDLPVLLSLPVRPDAIILSKTLIIFAYQIPFLLLSAVPLWIASVVSQAFSIGQIVLIILLSVLVPAAAVTILGIITILVMQFLPFFNNKDRYNLVIGIAAIFAAGGIGWISGMNEAMEGFGSISGMSIVFPQIEAAVQAVCGMNPLWIIVSLLFTPAVLGIYAWCANRFYLKAAMASSASAPKKLKKAREGKLHSLSDTFVITDIKRLLRTPAYITNNVLGAFILPVILTIMCLTVPEMAEMRDLLRQVDFNGLFRELGLEAGCAGLAAGVILSLMFGDMNSIAGTAISREGAKGVAWMKSVPVSLQTQLNAKVITGWIFSVLGMASFLIPVLIMAKLPLSFILSYLAGSAVTCLMVNQLCLIADIRFPKLEWSNEAAPVKNNYVIVFEVLLFMLIAACAGGLLVWLGTASLEGWVLNAYCSMLAIVFLIADVALWKAPAAAFRKWL